MTGKHFFKSLGLFALVFLTACIGGSGGKQKANCGPGQTFNSTSRTCVGAVVQDGPPVPTLTDYSIGEDSGLNTVTLTYNNPDGGDILGCNAWSYSDGLVRSKVVNGVRFDTKSHDAAGQEVSVEFVDNGVNPTSVSIASSENRRAITISYKSLPVSDLPATIAATINADILARIVVDASVSTVVFPSATSEDYFDELKCTCNASVCTAEIKPADNWHGNATFFYTITDVDGTSRTQQVDLVVSQVNDTPLASDGDVTTSEDTPIVADLSDFTVFSITGNYFEAHDGNDLRTTVQDIVYISKSTLITYINYIDHATTLTPVAYFSPTGLGGWVNIEFDFDTDTTTEIVDAIEASSAVSAQIRVINNKPGVAQYEQPLTKLRPVISPGFGDQDASGTTLTYEVVTLPSYGTLSGNVILPGGGFTYTPDAGYNQSQLGAAIDSFTYRVLDAEGVYSETKTISIYVNADANTDSPLGITATAIETPSGSFTFTEDMTSMTLTVDWSHPDTDVPKDAEYCNITGPYTSIYPIGNCTCSVGTTVGEGTCTVLVRPMPHVMGAQTFTYTVSDLTPVESTSTGATANITIVDVDDQPPAAYTSGKAAISFDESTTSVSAGPVDFSLDAMGGGTITHPDGLALGDVKFSIVTAPTNGTLTNCMDLTGSTGDTDVSCTYEPKDGNVADSGSARSVVQPEPNLAFHARAAGTFGDNISVEMIGVNGFSQSGRYAMAWVEYTGNNPTVKVVYNNDATGTPNTDIQWAIANGANGFADYLVQVEVTGAGNYAAVPGTYNLAGGVDSADKFVYRITEINDDVISTTDVTVPIEINPVNDAPVICEYTPFSDSNTACGMAGCIGDSEPSQVVSNPADGLVYYDSSSATGGTCWKASGGTWSIVSSSISDHTVNELNPIIIDTVKINEGGGGSEAIQTISITGVTSSNTILLPVNNIKFYYDANDDGDFNDTGERPTAGGDVFPDGATAADAHDFRIVITPIAGQTGTSTVTIDITDDDTPAGTTSVSFDITVNDDAAQHGGWINISATGPKINKFGQVRETRTFCPYSRYLCTTSKGSNTDCTGTTTPVNNSKAVPENPDAIYYDSSGDKCYWLKRTSIGDLNFVGKTTGSYTVELSSGGTFGAETVSISGSAITVAIQDGISTTTTIKTAIENDSSANALIKVEDTKPNSAQNIASSTAVYEMAQSNWETFSTTCNISSSQVDDGCDGLGSFCIGYGNPNDTINGYVITPSNRNTAYYDRANDVCYRSIETDGSGADQDGDGNMEDWTEYTATGQAYLSWNQFNNSGSGSISGYNVYRRIANEQFDYNSPINRSLLSAASTVSFTDDVDNSFEPPIPGTVYYYEVRPVIGGIPTDTNEVFKTARVVVPPNNMSFVHRWIVNQSMCKLMNSTTTDPSNNYRCEYEGPGDTGGTAGTNYYDIGKDMLVHRYEAGCSYSSNCDTADGECIGIDDPDGIVSADTNDVYYSRNNGKCWINTSAGSGTTWSHINARCDFHPTACSGGTAACTGAGAPGANVAAAGSKYLDTTNNVCYFSEGGGNWETYTCQFSIAACGGFDCYDDDATGTGFNIAGNNPNGLVTAAVGAVYYSPGDGSCWQNSNGATLWTNVTGTEDLPYTDVSNVLTKMRNAELPPLTHVDQEDAASICSRESVPEKNILGMGSNLKGKLPARKDQIAYGMWDMEELTASVITSREAGLSINSSSKCNSSSADGLDTRYSDVDVPDSNNFFTLPGTETSEIRSMMTGTTNGAEGTGLCASRFAIQDHAGNVSEWASDRVYCPDGSHQCLGLTSASSLALANGTNDFQPGQGLDAWTIWSLDGIHGPCVESGSGCDTYFDLWSFEDERFSATKFSIPMGIPVDSDSSTANTSPDFSSSLVVTYFAEVGPTSGITNDNLHNDSVDINNAHIEKEASGCGGLKSGGHYATGDGAGSWHLEIVPCTDRGDKTTTNGSWTTEDDKTGFRCIFDISPTGVYDE